MWGKRGGDIESAKVARVAAALHLVHGFTDVASTDGGDGSKGEVRSEQTGKKEMRVGCGVYEGMQPGQRGGGEEAEEAAKRWMGGGMFGGGLPAWYEVVDAELMGILVYLEEVVRRAVEAGEEAAGRRCLVVSDCKGALELMEWAWRGGQVGALRRSKRGGILEAICRMRAQLGLAPRPTLPPP